MKRSLVFLCLFHSCAVFAQSATGNHFSNLKARILRAINPAVGARTNDISLAGTACPDYVIGSSDFKRIRDCFGGADPAVAAIRHFGLDATLFRVKANRGSSIYDSAPYIVDGDDSIDWLALQAAVWRGRGQRVEITPAPGDYVINQPVVLFGRTRLQWMPDKMGEFSFVRFERAAAGDILGTVFTNLNPYSGYPTRVDEFDPLPENILVGNAHVDAGYASGIKGINAFAFARGVRSVWITGGVVKNSVFDAKVFGGKAFQCEQGCQDLLIERVEVRSTSFGVASTSFHDDLFDSLLPAAFRGTLAQSTVFAKDVTMTEVEIPFFSISDVTTPADRLTESALVASLSGAVHKQQALLVEGFRARRSGVLSRTRIPNTAPALLGDCAQQAPDLGATNFDYLYFKNPAAADLPAEASAIIYSHLGRNVYVSGGRIDNTGFGRAGALFGGAAGSNIHLRGIEFRGDVDRLFRFVGALNGLVNPAAAGIAGFEAADIRHTGHSFAVAELAPNFQVRKINGRCVRFQSDLHMQNISLNRVTFTSANSLVGAGARHYSTAIGRGILINETADGGQLAYEGTLAALSYMHIVERPENPYVQPDYYDQGGN